MPKVTKKKASPLLDEDENTKGGDAKVGDNEKSEVAGNSAVAGGANRIEKEMRSDAEMAKNALAKEEKVHFMIPLSQGEKIGAFEDVWINGFHTRVPKGRMSILPKSIAEMLANKYAVEAEAGAEFRLDLDDEKAENLA